MTLLKLLAPVGTLPDFAVVSKPRGGKRLTVLRRVVVYGGSPEGRQILIEADPGTVLVQNGPGNISVMPADAEMQWQPRDMSEFITWAREHVPEAAELEAEDFATPQ